MRFLSHITLHTIYALFMFTILSLWRKLKIYVKSSFHVNAYYLIINSGFAALIGFVFWLVAARFYSAVDVGLASATISAAALIATIAELGLGFGLIRFLPGSSDRQGFINTCFTLGFLVSILVGVIFLLGLEIWSPALLFLKQEPLMLVFILLYLPLSTNSVMGDRVFISLRQSKFTFIRHSAIILEIPLAIVFTTMLGSPGILLAPGIAVGASLVLSLFVLIPRVQKSYFPKPALKLRLLTEVFNYSLGNHFATLIQSVPTWIFPLLVVNVVGPQENAYFYIAWTIGITLSAIPSAISYSFFAEGSHDEKKLFSFGSSALKLSLGLLVPAIGIIFLIGDKLLSLFGQAYSEQGLTLLRVVSLSAIPASFNQMYLMYKRVTKETKAVLTISLVLVVLALGSSYMLIPQMGLIGPGVAYLGANTVVALWLGISTLPAVLRARRLNA